MRKGTQKKKLNQNEGNDSSNGKKPKKNWENAEMDKMKTGKAIKTPHVLVTRANRLKRLPFNKPIQISLF